MATYDNITPYRLLSEASSIDGSGFAGSNIAKIPSNGDDWDTINSWVGYYFLVEKDGKFFIDKIKGFYQPSTEIGTDVPIDDINVQLEYGTAIITPGASYQIQS